MPAIASLSVKPGRAEQLQLQLETLRTRRRTEDDRQVCWERAQILHACRERYADLPRVRRQAAVVRELCRRITPVIEPEDVVAGRMPEVIPSAEQERFIANHPELFREAGAPGLLDSLGIYIPDWERLLSEGIGGRVRRAREMASHTHPDERERRQFLLAMADSLESLSLLIRRYAGAARRIAAAESNPDRRIELTAIAHRCERVSWSPPLSFVEALQLLQITHMALSCLIGGRDVTPGRMDQYLLPFYQHEVRNGDLSADEAAVLLAMFFLRLSQMAGSGTDFDDNVRRTPCKYTHLYVTVGGCAPDGRLALNEMSWVVLEAVDRLNYREPTVVVRHRSDMPQDFKRAVARLIRARRPVTMYNDEMVIRALVRQGTPLAAARGYAHSACHNVLVAGHEAASGPGGFHNLPRLILLAMTGGRDLLTGQREGASTAEPAKLTTFEDFWEALTAQVRAALHETRREWKRRWRTQYADSCPLLQSALMEFCFQRQQPCWRAAPVSHFNHHLMGLATAVDSLVALQRLVFQDRNLTLEEFAEALRENWEGREALRSCIVTRLPRFGQDHPFVRQLTSRLGRLWVEEVERASAGMSRLSMWPGFYSHMVHIHAGRSTPATPDGRRAGEPLSENQGPSYLTTGCTPTSILNSMSALPFDHTPSGAASLTLSATDVRGESGLHRLWQLLDGYFQQGGLHLQVNVLEPGVLEQAMKRPEQYANLVVRVTGFSAYFTRLSRDVQEDLLRRWRRDS